jgi:NADPH-dependent F420 reductase
MQIAILGTGNVGGTLGKRLAALGNTIHFGSRDPASAKAQAAAAEANGARVSTFSEAVADSDLVILAAPWTAACELAASLGDLRGQVLIDCTNPLNASFTGLDLGFDVSAAERIQAAAPTARVVKAFNTASAATMADPLYGGVPATMFYCGDDDEARREVGQLLQTLGFEAVDGGPLRNARYLEPMAMFYIHLAMNGWGGNCAFKMLRREKQ